MRCTGTAGLLIAGGLALLNGVSSQIMSIDLGHEFFKVALMRQGAPLEIVLNTHSKRKTTTAVSFNEAIRTFGDDALAHQGKAPAKVPMFFHSTMGRNYTQEDIAVGGKWWADFGLGELFYSFHMGYDELRGTPTFKIGEDQAHLEEVLASIFFFAKKMAEESGEGTVIKVRDLVVTVPSSATLRQRQSISAAAEIAGLRLLTLVHETSAFAVHRALDFSVEQGAVEHALYYNLGSRKVEVSIVRLEARSAGMVKGKYAPVVSVIGSAMDYRVGGHLMDLKIAEEMLNKFKQKFPKLADGISTNRRALRKLLSQASKTKATLSANKQAPFTVESLYEDTDFQASITRDQFETMCSEMFGALTEPIDRALAEANLTMADIKHVEVVGGAWRVPKVQQVLNEYFESGRGEKLPLGQHLNGEEAGALGAALVAANSSTSFRIKKIFFSDISQHEYSVQVASLKGEWERNVTVLYPVGVALGGKKKLSLEMEEDFLVRLFEDGVLLSEYTVSGLEDLLKGKWKDYNLTGTPKVTAVVPLESSGIIELKSPAAIVEESHWVNVTKEKPKANATKANGTNGSANGTAAEGEQAENASEAGAANASEEPEVVLKLKKKKHEKKLKVTRRDFKPVPLSEDQIQDLHKKLKHLAEHEHEVQAVAGIKNELEAAIYSAREKMENEHVMQVTTEAQREEVIKLATELEDWVHGDVVAKSEYETRVNALSNLMTPIDERVYEMELRSGLDEHVTESVQVMKGNVAHVEKNMSWVNSSKTEAFSKKLEEFESWWAKKQASQAALPAHEAPAFTAKEVNDKVLKLQKDIEKLLAIKKPKEPKAKKNATDDKASKKDKGKGKDKEKTKPADLPADVESTKAAIEELRKQKSEAVEKEDFDKAQSLKAREKELQDHLKKLKSEEKSEL